MTAVACYAIAAMVAVANLVAFLAVRGDKRLAQTRAGRRTGQRVPERVFWGLSLFGGWVLGGLAMAIYRHKVRKGWFLAGFWVAAVLGALAMAGWLSILGCL